jgi:hypothetical protein
VDVVARRGRHRGGGRDPASLSLLFVGL